VKICAVPTQQNWRKMMRKNKKRKQRGCDVAKVIDTVEQAVSTAKKVYRAVEPIVKTIVAHRRKTK
jgi:predicted GTPase